MLTTAPPVAQSRLAELLAERVAWVTGDPDGDSGGNADCNTVEPDTGTDGTTVLVLLRSLRLADVVDGAREFAAALDPGEAAAWRRSWTRTRFLFGNPGNLTPANPARVVAPGATAAWLGPFPHTRLPGLSRLLKPVTGELPELPGDVDLPGTGPRRVLRIAACGLTLTDYLVHLHHTIAEAVLLGRLRPGEPLRLSHRPVLGTGSTDDRPAYARVLPEPGEAGRLRLLTWLSSA